MILNKFEKFLPELHKNIESKDSDIYGFRLIMRVMDLVSLFIYYFLQESWQASNDESTLTYLIVFQSWDNCHVGTFSQQIPRRPDHPIHILFIKCHCVSISQKGEQKYYLIDFCVIGRQWWFRGMSVQNILSRPQPNNNQPWISGALFLVQFTVECENNDN